ncbi:alpha-L-fucosidase [Rhizomicrobium electricum]|uniref:alpha-L-fucosidase n=1 Tax=Rhizomicrobium electricum TaxID=480070 RepID=A0ABN1FBG3_9PROT|nr:alpha-L-fucosidase [Rhizomicrobium electricum]NIJ50751.1 alpha-L-fucosidase [Rhizomicrobium electricum]
MPSKISCAAAVTMLGFTAAFGQPAEKAIPYADVQVIAAGDSAAVIAEKAAKVLPRANQRTWMRLENTYFLHFGPNTFRGLEWGDGREDPAIFNPSALDAEQWVRTIKEAGGREIILVAKHHDGLNLWPTRYSDHSVAASPWRGGKGDLVREVADAARKHGVKLGLYLSPADLWQLKTNPKNPSGYYGDDSAKKRSTIPTDPASFTSDPAKPRASKFGRFSYTVDDYNRYFLNQLYELLTEYGPVQEVWFDGANPDPSVHETYDYAAWYDLIRKLQPGAMIFGKGPDARWVGNESGVGRTTEWSVIPLPKAPADFNWPDMQDEDLGSRAKLVPGSHLWWFPAEVNTSILYGWFWHPKKRVKTAADLVDVYYQSVGRNGNMLLNLPPDTRGLIPDDQLASLRLMAEVVKDTFAKNLAAGGTLTADSTAKGHAAARVLDGSLDTWWEAARGQRQATLTLQLPAPVTFDVVSLQEAVDRRGQRIENFAVDVWDGSAWKQIDAQTTIGHKRLLRWDTPVTSDRVRIRITAARLEPALAEIGLFKQAELVRPPVISERTVDGLVTLNSPKGLKVVYTVDGSVPTPTSPVYSGPVALVRGGVVNAACVGADGRLGMMASKSFSGFAPAGWTSADGVKAIDGDPATIWQGKTLPTSLTVDMGRALAIGGFSYLPSGDAAGAVDTYRFETSLDGRIWTISSEGRFGNIENSPLLQEATFAPVTARFFRFTALKLAKGTAAGIAEISVLPAETAP